MDRFYDSSIKDSSEVWVQDEKYVQALQPMITTFTLETTWDFRYGILEINTRPQMKNLGLLYQSQFFCRERRLRKHGGQIEPEPKEKDVFEGHFQF